MREESAKPDVFVVRIALRQHGVVSYPQLNAAGVIRSSISRRIEAGRLHRAYRGVYAVAHCPVSRRGWFRAATLALGEGSVISHPSAAVLWALLPDLGGYLEVSIPGQGGRRKREGMVVHRSLTLDAGSARARTRPGDDGPEDDQGPREDG